MKWMKRWTAALLAAHGIPVYGESRIEELLK